ncbi:MAG: hypothetical protein KF841_02420 [Phycisphaerae bacterium]|nr:hypothetical protein [Phycisphaerae bacterium]
MIAIIAVWTALGAMVTTCVVLLVPTRNSFDTEAVITLLPYTIAFSATLAAAVLWSLRKCRADEPGVAGQRLQAIASLAINSLTFAILLFALQDFQFAVVGLVVEFGFLYVCYWGYTRVLVPDKR